MGGRAFLSGRNPLNVIRLPTDQYIKLRDHYRRSAASTSLIQDLTNPAISILLRFYNRAVVPSEAPGKADHGDIDVLVDRALFNFTVQDLAKGLGAVEHTTAGGNYSFAIRLPEEGRIFFQLDIHKCKEGCFEWESVLYSYGDIWRIIGSSVTRFGLAINDTGLHARIEEIEATHKKHSLLPLTRDPLEVMNFLGLDHAGYEKGFSTLDELFEWAVSMPLFRSKFFEKETVSTKEQRLREKRPMYSSFVTEWLPKKMTLQVIPATSQTVDQNVPRAALLNSADPFNSRPEPAEERNIATSPNNERKELLNKALQSFDKLQEYRNMLENHQKRT